MVQSQKGILIFNGFMSSLGITQHLIKSGIARLEEVHASDGTLENLYVRVRYVAR